MAPPGMDGLTAQKSVRHDAGRFSIIQIAQIARVTLPERRHLVQTYTWVGVPFTIAFTRLTLGFQVRLERR